MPKIEDNALLGGRHTATVLSTAESRRALAPLRRAVPM
jgi:hypothetical protein